MDRQIQTDRYGQTDTDRQIQTDRYRQTDTDRQIQTNRYRQTEWEIGFSWRKTYPILI